MTIQNQIQISLIKTANDIALTNALTLYESIPTPSGRPTVDAYIPSKDSVLVTYTQSARLPR